MKPKIRTNSEGLDLIRKFEGLLLVSQRDRWGIWNIGYGRSRMVGPLQKCTQDQAEAWLLEDVAGFERGITQLLAEIPLGDNQFSALTSFVYNVGFGQKGEKDGFMHLKDGTPSTMLTLLRNRDFASAASQFIRWDKVEGVPCEGILKRRMAEEALFVKPDTV